MKKLYFRWKKNVSHAQCNCLKTFLEAERARRCVVASFWSRGHCFAHKTEPHDFKLVKLRSKRP